jgi:hypothetical protein
VRKVKRAESNHEGRKPCAPEARQRIFPGKVVLGHLPVSELVARVAFEDKTDTEDGAMKEEVPKGKSHRAAVFRKELGEIFPPSLPPQEGGKEREK